MPHQSASTNPLCVEDVHGGLFSISGQHWSASALLLAMILCSRVSHVSVICLASSTCQGSGVWVLQPLTEPVRGEHYICSPLIEERTSCNVRPVFAMLNLVHRLQLFFLSRHALVMFAQSCLARARSLSRTRRHVWDRAGAQFLAFSGATFCSML